MDCALLPVQHEFSSILGVLHAHIMWLATYTMMYLIVDIQEGKVVSTLSKEVGSCIVCKHQPVL